MLWQRIKKKAKKELLFPSNFFFLVDIFFSSLLNDVVSWIDRCAQVEMLKLNAYMRNKSDVYSVGKKGAYINSRRGAHLSTFVVCRKNATTTVGSSRYALIMNSAIIANREKATLSSNIDAIPALTHSYTYRDQIGSPPFSYLYNSPHNWAI